MGTLDTVQTAVDINAVAVPGKPTDQDRARKKVEDKVQDMIQDFYHNGLKERFESFKKANSDLSPRGAFIKFAVEEASNMRVKALDKTPNRVPGFEKLDSDTQNEMIIKALTKRLEYHRNDKLKKDIPEKMTDELAAAMKPRLEADAAKAQQMIEGAVRIEDLSKSELADVIYTASTKSPVQDPTYMAEMEALRKRNEGAFQKLGLAYKEEHEAREAINKAPDLTKDQKYIDAEKAKTEAISAYETAKVDGIKAVTDYFTTGRGKDLPQALKDAATKQLIEAIEKPTGEKNISFADLAKTVEEKKKIIDALPEAQYLAYKDNYAPDTKANGALVKIMADVQAKAEAAKVAASAVTTIIDEHNNKLVALSETYKAKQQAVQDAEGSPEVAAMTTDAAAAFKRVQISVSRQKVEGSNTSELSLAYNGKQFVDPANHVEYLKTKDTIMNFLNAGVGKGIYVPEIENAIKEGREPNYKLAEEQANAEKMKGDKFNANKRAANMLRLVFSGQLEDSLAEFDAEKILGREKDNNGLRGDGNYSQGRNYGRAVYAAMREIIENGSATGKGKAEKAEDMAKRIGLDKRAVEAVYGTIDEKKTEGMNDIDMNSDQGVKDYMKNVNQFGLFVERQVILATGRAYGIAVGDLGETRDVKRQRTLGQTFGVIFGFENFSRVVVGAVAFGVIKAQFNK